MDDPANNTISSLDVKGNYLPLKVNILTPSHYGGQAESVNWSEMSTVSWENTSNGDYLDGFPYPSKYSWWHIILSSVVVTFIIIVIVLGNTLVIVAIAKDNNLKGLQNWFIASLAVSDLLLGALIMPFSLANELMGYWYFGTTLCQMWLSIDVLLCTASILNLCLISLDRYWSITRAVSYVRNRTRKRAIIMITTVWVLSGIICFPPLVGWKRPQNTKFGFPLCLLSEEEGYVVYSTLGSFYIPLIVMVIVYFKIYLAARKLARKHLKKKQIVLPHGGKQSTSTSSTAKENHSPKLKDSFEKLKPISDSEVAILDKGSGNESTAMSDSCNDTSKGIKMAVISHKGIKLSTLDEKRNLLCEDTDLTESEANNTNVTEILKNPLYQRGEFTNEDVSSDVDSSNRQYNIKHNGYRPLKTSVGPVNDTQLSHAVNSNDHNADDNCFHKGLDKNNDSQYDEKDLGMGQEDVQGKDPVVPSLNIVEPHENERHRRSKSPSLEFGEIGSPDSRKDLLSPNNNSAVFKLPSTKSKKHKKDRKALDDPERMRRKIARAKERRATIVLGVIMATFILCWLPFFSTYVISTLAKLNVPELVFAIMFWAGYCNSALNPIIYTIFNRDFRLAFQRILFGRRW